MSRETSTMPSSIDTLANAEETTPIGVTKTLAPAAIAPSAAASDPFSFSLPGTTGKGVLLLHGLTGAPAEMRYMARQLNREGFAVHAPLMAGHGVSADLLLKTNYRHWVASVVAAFDRFANEVDEVYVAGICLGGLLGVALAKERPAVKGLAVYSVTFNHDGWSMPKGYRSGRMLKHLGSLPFVRRIGVPEAPPYGIKNERLREWIIAAPDMGVEGSLDVFPLGALAQQYGLADHVARIGGQVKTPTLIIHAEEDDQAHPRNAKRLRSVLGGPVSIEWLNNSYHMIHVDQQRAEVARLTNRFFSDPDAALRA